MDDIDMTPKIDLFKNMDGWQEMLDYLSDIEPEKREAALMKFINFACGMIL